MTYRLACTNISYRSVIHLRNEVWQMSNEKIKPVLNGTAETMLQCFYARAMHSRNPKTSSTMPRRKSWWKSSTTISAMQRSPETIEVRDSVYQESGRISTIACSVLDPAWAEQVKVRGKMLFIIEGLTMYMSAECRR